jgi:hypothetical protein
MEKVVLHIPAGSGINLNICFNRFLSVLIVAGKLISSSTLKTNGFFL